MNLKAIAYFTTFVFLSLFQEIKAEDYYWVGGSGSWSQLNHWATSSGGNVYHSSVPGADDNVIFDLNSFNLPSNEVIIDVESAICANLDFSNLTKNVFILGNNELYINQTLVMHSLVEFVFNGSLIFEAGNSTHTFITENKNFPCNIIFAGRETNWTIDGDLITEKALQIKPSRSSFSFGNIVVGKTFTVSSFNSTVSVSGNITTGEEFVFNGGHTVFSNSGSFNCDEYFTISANDSEFSLGGVLSVNKDISVSSGKLISNGHEINTSKFRLRANGIADISNSTLNLAEEFDISSINCSLTSNNTAIYFSSNDALLQADIAVNIDLVDFANSGTFSSSNSVIQELVFHNAGQILGEQNQFAYAHFYNQGNFRGNHQFSEIFLTGGHEYIFAKNNTQTITNSLSTDANCGAYLVFRSDTENFQSAINKASGTVNLDYLIVQDMDFSGGAVFSSNYYTNIQNTTGITGTEAVGRNLYWVGGAGLWSDPGHWSLQSGGSGGECIPSPLDNVFFDANSFSGIQEMITIESEQAFCNDFDWTGVANNPVFTNTSTNKTLNIFGSMWLSSNMNFQLNSETKFRSKSIGEEIKTDGNSIACDLIFDGDGGNWTLVDELFVDDKSLFLKKGNLSTGGNQITTKNFSSDEDDGFSKSFDFTDSDIYITDSWSAASTELNIIATGSHIFMEKADAQMNSGDNFSYNNISFTSTDSQNAEIIGSGNSINQLRFYSNGKVNISASTVTELRFDAVGTLNGADNLFDNAHFYDNGFFEVNNTFNILELTPGYIYTLTQDRLQTINTNLNANGNCNSPVTLISANEGSTSAIKKQNTELVLDYVVIRDIEAVATGNNYTINNATDLGNNPGWVINDVVSKDYYWVGGSGNWDDMMHWALTSGGAGGTAGTCLPTQNDNVYFDENSFSANGETVTVNTEVVNCKTMNWQNITYDVNFRNNTEALLNIYGSLYLSDKLTWNFLNEIWFKGSNENFEIDLAGNSLRNNVWFDGSSAAWNLINNFTCLRDVNLVQGTLSAIDRRIDVIGFISGSDKNSEFIITNSTLNIAITWDVFSNFQIQCDNSEINLNSFHSIFTSNSENYLEYNVLKINGSNSTFLSNNSSINKLITDKCAIDGDNCLIDSLTANGDATINGELNISCANFQSRVDIYGSQAFGNASFNGLAVIVTDNEFGTAHFLKDAIIYGNNVYDTLRFSPDHAYQLGNYRTQTVNKYLDVRGNNCYKIDLRATSNGASANINVANGIVDGYALTIKGIKGLGGAQFFAGGPSSDLGGNISWVFGDPPGYIYGFGNDSIYIEGQTALITTNAFNANENTDFIWNIANDGSSLETDEPGKYQVEAIYYSEPEHCSFHDEINIHFATFKKPSCRKLADGEISIMSDPTVEYDYLWSNGSTDTDLNNLPAGEYSVEITDKLTGQKAVRSFMLVEADSLQAELQVKQPSCIGQSDASVELIISGGREPYDFKWQDDFDLNSLQRSNLPEGAYSVIVNDSANCETRTIEAVILEPLELQMNIDKVSGGKCNGDNDAVITANISGGTKPYSFQWSNGLVTDTIENLSFGEYSVIVTDANNCAILHDTLNLIEPENLRHNVHKKDQVCPGTKTGNISLEINGGNQPYTFKWQHTDDNFSRLDTLSSGTYNVTITDNFNCETIVEEIEILSGKQIEIENINIVAPLCYNESSGSIGIESIGGYGNLRFGIDEKEPVSGNLFEGLAAGEYLITAIDDSSCTTEFYAEIQQPTPLTVDLSQENPDCSQNSNGFFTIDILGGIEPYTVNWLNPNMETIFEPENLKTGQYILQVYDDNSCFYTDTLNLEAEDCMLELFIPNAFSPNNDGTNDYFELGYKYIPAAYSIYIYSRWGGKVYESGNIEEAWDGKYKGRICPPGVYFYVIQYFDNGEMVNRKGTIHLFSE